ncbi:MAG: hypothetical protein HY978_04680 [Candidatus Liptonbacteria bacterium]|nr:hypothetical protein [Candidatus Liptonbacteria bacterium]
MWLVPVAIAWSLPWKGVAIWKAIRRQHKIWFLALLVINTLGILEILYLFVFSRNEKLAAEEQAPVAWLIVLAVVFGLAAAAGIYWGRPG